MKLIKPSIYLNVIQEQPNPGGTQLIRVEADGKRVIHHANQSHSSIKFGCFEKAFVNLQNSNLIDQSRIGEMLNLNFLHGYNTTIVLMQTAPDNGISMLQVLLQRIGSALSSVNSIHSDNGFLDFVYGTAENSSPRFESIDNWTLFVDEFISEKADQLSTSLGYLSFRYHLLDEFVSTLNVIVVPEIFGANFRFLEYFRAILLGNSAINNLFFASLVRMILQNAHVTLIASLTSTEERAPIGGENEGLSKEINSPTVQVEAVAKEINSPLEQVEAMVKETHSSSVPIESSSEQFVKSGPSDQQPNESDVINETATKRVISENTNDNLSKDTSIFNNSSVYNELSSRTLELLSTLDSLAQFRLVISAGLLNKQKACATTVPAIIGCNDDYVMFQDYQNASLRVVEALECEMSKVKQTKEFLTRELSLLKCDLSQHQRNSEVRFELFEEEESKRRETEELMYKTCLNDLREHLNDLNEELQQNSEDYQQHIEAMQKDLQQSTLTLTTTQQHLQETKEKLQQIEVKLQESKNENAHLSSKLIESQSSFLSAESNYQSQLSSLQKANTLLQQSISRLEGEKKNNVEEVEEKIQALQDEIVRLQAKLDKSVECNKATQTTIRSLNREKNELMNKVDELQDKCTVYEEEQQSLQQNIQDLRKRKDSTRVASSTRLENQLGDERKAHVETQSRLDSIENSIKEQIKEAVNKERAAVKNERIEMQKLLKESQERIIELEELVQKSSDLQSFSQGNNAKRARSSGQSTKQKAFHSTASNQLVSEEENLPNNVIPKSSHVQTAKFVHNQNARFDDEADDSPVSNSKMSRLNSNTRSQVPLQPGIGATMTSSFGHSDKSKIASGNKPTGRANNSSVSVAPHSPKKLSTFAPKATFMPSFAAATTGAESISSGASILAGVSFDTSFADAAKRTRLAGTIPNNSLPQFDHQRVLRVQSNNPSTASNQSASTASKRPIPTDILNDFKIPATVSK